MDNTAHTGLLAVLIVAIGATTVASVVFFAQQRPSPAVQTPAARPTNVQQQQAKILAAPPSLAARQAEIIPSTVRDFRPEAALFPVEPPPRQAQETQTSLRALHSHPWWATTIRPAELESLLGLLMAHGTGIVFFNSQGEGIWVGPQHILCPLDSLIWYDVLHCHSINEVLVYTLGERRKLVPLRIGLGRRLTRSEAIALLQDGLNIPDNKELGEKGEKNLKGFFAALENQR